MAFSATLTVPSGTVASTLTDFVVRVDLSDLPSAWWTDTTSDLGNVRVKSSGSVIPFDITLYDRATETGELFFKSTLSTGDNDFTVETVDGATALAVTDANGRNNVWVGFDAVYVLGDSTTDRTGTGGALSTAGTVTADAWVPDSVVAPASVQIQGVAQHTTGDYFNNGDNILRRYDDTWSLEASNTTARSDASVTDSNHMGDSCIHGGELYIPINKFPWSGGVVEWIGVYDLSTLAFVRKYDISSTGHQISGICSDGTYFYSVGYSSGTNVATSIQKWNSDWTHHSTLTTTSISQKQGIAILDANRFIVSANSGVWVVDRSSGTATKWYDGAFEGENEGTCVTLDNRVVIHSNQGRLRYLRENDGNEYVLGGIGNLYWQGVPKRTSWTMGLSHVLARGGVTAGLISYSDSTGASANRATLATRSTNAHGIWNSTDVWIEDPVDHAAESDFATRHRLHHTQNTTTDRKLWRNGVAVATDTTVAQRPGGTTATAVIGASNQTGTERSQGVFDYVYWRNGVLSADWLAAEYESWESPSTFYSIEIPPTEGSVAGTLPELTSSVAGYLQPEGVVDGAIPEIVTDAMGAFSPAGVSGPLEATLPEVDADMTAGLDIPGIVDAVLPEIFASCDGLVLAEGALEQTIPEITSSLSGSHAIASVLTGVLPELTATLAGTVEVSQVTETADRAGGRTRSGLARMVVEYEVEPAASPTPAIGVMAQSVPEQVMSGGRPA